MKSFKISSWVLNFDTCKICYLWHIFAIINTQFLFRNKMRIGDTNCLGRWFFTKNLFSDKNEFTVTLKKYSGPSLCTGDWFQDTLPIQKSQMLIYFA